MQSRIKKKNQKTTKTKPKT